MPNAVFVYGTLQPGEINAHYFDSFDGKWEKGHVLGQLENQGWGADHGFPGIRLDPQGVKVQGSLFISENINAILSLLDELEGADYRRNVTCVFLESGIEIDAHIYELASIR